MEVLEHGQFTALDYCFFVVVFFICVAIGLYYAFKSRNKVITVDDYLLGGRNMAIFPVVCSLIATTISGSSIVGLAAEAYSYGTHILMFAVSMLAMPFALSWIFLPIFSQLKLSSSFKYFELRFNKRVRLLASGIFLLTGLIFLPVTVYVPALSFQKVTGLDTYVTVTILSLLCATYTAIGGFKAVIWTDVLQLAIIFVSCVIVAVVGINSANGLSNVLSAANRGGRIIFIDIDHVNSRSSFLGYIFSASFVCIYQFGLNQPNLQRFLSLSSNRKMLISAWILCLVFMVFLIFSPFLGVVIYANYEKCDPFSAKLIKKMDQILPYFIQDKASLFTGFNGIFVAGIFSASLSTTSSYLNTMSGVIYEDFLSQRWSLNERSAKKIMTAIVFILGIVQILLVLFIEKMGTIAQITSQCMSLNTGSLLTLFFLGATLPKANSIGAQAGAITAVITVLCFIIGGINNKPDAVLPLRTDGCINATVTDFVGNSSDDSKENFWLFDISFIYYGLIGTLSGICIGYLTSLLTGGNTVEDQRLLAPFLRRKVLGEEEITLQREPINVCD